MSLETGKIYDGKVRNIAPYGAFVEVSLDGKVHTGMVHISEVSNTYVNEIRDHLTEGQEVKVKVLKVDENGKISLSIKKASESPAPKPRLQRNNNQRNFNSNGNNGFSKEGFTPANRQPVAEKPQTSESSFEEMLSKFKQSSEEKMSDLKRNMDGKRRNTKRIR